MASALGAFATDGGDPRINNPLVNDDADHSGINWPVTTTGGAIAPHHRQLHDHTVTFQEYQYYAERTRAEEQEAARTETATTGLLQVLFPTKSSAGVTPINAVNPASPGSSTSGRDEKDGLGEKEALGTQANSQSHRLNVTETEWTNASRALRTASGAACFYLITTDILGPFGVG